MIANLKLKEKILKHLKIHEYFKPIFLSIILFFSSLLKGKMNDIGIIT